MAWQDLPYDSTGELKRLRAFIEDNIDICECVAVSIIVIQVYNVYSFFFFFKNTTAYYMSKPSLDLFKDYSHYLFFKVSITFG